MPPDPIQNSEEKVLGARSSKRLFELDALRGAAAFTVVWHHLRSALPGDPLHHRLFYPFFEGHQAVLMFFVLSGYVLGIPYWKDKSLPYGRYLVRRIFRVYAPYFVALLIAWLCAEHFLYSHLPLTPWFYKTWQTPLTGKLFLQQVFMSTEPAINTAFWSLHYEMEMSILFPLFCYLIKKIRTPAALLLMTALIVAGGFFTVLDLTYAAFFLAGALLSLHQQTLTNYYRTLSKGVILLLIVLSFALYYAPFPERYPHARQVVDFLTMVGSVGLIVISINSNAAKTILRNPVLEYLGRISFSLYLVHGTILFVLLDVLYGHTRLSVIAVALGVSCWAAAHLFCIAVEEPFMRLGKVVTTAKSQAPTVSRV